MSSPPLVSVIIPAYNCSKYIEEAIQSVLNQSHENTEIIVINDGSTDNTLNVLQSFIDKVLILNQINSGAAIARNNGMNAAKGAYIAFLDSDDYWLPDKLSLQVEYLEKHPDVQMVYCHWQEWTANKDGKFTIPENIITNYSLKIDKENSGWTYNKLLLDCHVHTSTVLMRRVLVKEVGDFNKKLRRGQDYDYWFRASRITKIDKLNPTLSLYRLHGESITKKPQPINYGVEVLNMALSKWGNTGPNGDVTDYSIVQKRLAELWFGFGYEHYKAGEKNIAINAFISTIKKNPAWIPPWIYLLKSLFRKS